MGLPALLTFARLQSVLLTFLNPFVMGKQNTSTERAPSNRGWIHHASDFRDAALRQTATEKSRSTANLNRDLLEVNSVGRTHSPLDQAINQR